MKFFLTLLVISTILESTFMTLPLTFILIIFAAIRFRNSDVFALAFFSGLLLDILSFKLIGFSSAFFVTFVFIIYLYQNKFEIETLHFIAMVAFIGSFVYLLLTGSSFLIIQSVLATLLTSVSFLVFQRSNRKVRSYHTGKTLKYN